MTPHSSVGHHLRTRVVSAAALVVVGITSCASGPRTTISSSGTPVPSGSRLVVVVLGGGTCTQHSTMPACEPMPLPGAVVVVTGQGSPTRLTTDDRGRAELAVAPGRYRLVAEPVAGWPVTAEPQVVAVPAAGTTVRLVHSTGFQ